MSHSSPYLAEFDLNVADLHDRFDSYMSQRLMVSRSFLVMRRFWGPRQDSYLAYALLNTAVLGRPVW